MIDGENGILQGHGQVGFGGLEHSPPKIMNLFFHNISQIS